MTESYPHTYTMVTEQKRLKVARLRRGVRSAAQSQSGARGSVASRAGLSTVGGSRCSRSRTATSGPIPATARSVTRA